MDFLTECNNIIDAFQNNIKNDESKAKKDQEASKEIWLNGYIKTFVKREEKTIQIFNHQAHKKTYRMVFLHKKNENYANISHFLLQISEIFLFTEDIDIFELTSTSLYSAFCIGLTPDAIVSQLCEYLSIDDNGKLTWKTLIETEFQTAGKIKAVMQRNSFDFISEEEQLLKNIKSMGIITQWSNNNWIVLEEILEITNSHERYIQSDIFSESLGKSNKFSIDKTMFVLSIHCTFRHVSILPICLCALKCSIYNKFNYRISEEVDVTSCTTGENWFRLKDSVTIRDYQTEGINQFFHNNQYMRSGILEMPCGSGKTIQGITLMTLMKSHTIILCHNSLGCQQWYEEIIKYTTISEKNVLIVEPSLNFKTIQQRPWPQVVIMTYYFLSEHTKGSKNKTSESGESRNKSNKNTFKKAYLQQIVEYLWGLMVLDEAHSVVSPEFQNITKKMRARCKVGLSATFVREDNRIGFLDILVGPKLYQASWSDLIARGYLANIQFYQVKVPLSETFAEKYRDTYESTAKNKTKILKRLCVFDTNRLYACMQLLSYHWNRGDKIIIFGHTILAMKYYAHALKYIGLDVPVIIGKTSEAMKEHYIQQFKTTNNCNCIILGKVGEVGINMPAANVTIQIDRQGGNQRQETQQAGRIIRPKQVVENHENRNPAKNKIDSYFYSLIATLPGKDKNKLRTVDEIDAPNRQLFLRKRGIQYKCISWSQMKKQICVEKNYKHVAPISKVFEKKLLNKIINDEEDDEEEYDEEEDEEEEYDEEEDEVYETRNINRKRKEEEEEEEEEKRITKNNKKAKLATTSNKNTEYDTSDSEPYDCEKSKELMNALKKNSEISLT